MNRRHLLTMGGAGVAALALPSFFPGRSGSTLLAQTSDPMLAEITKQLQRAYVGLAAAPPQGNARQLAALFRMASAWARSNQFDTWFKQRFDAALATEGPVALAARMATFDRAALIKQLGLPMPPAGSLKHPNYAQGIGLLRAGQSFERACRNAAWIIDKRANQFDRHMAVLNGREPDMVLRRVQDGCVDDIDCDGVPDSIDGSDDRPSPTNCAYDDATGTIYCCISGSPEGCQPTVGPSGFTEEDCRNLDFLNEVFLAILGAGALLSGGISVALYVLIVGVLLEAYEWHLGC